MEGDPGLAFLFSGGHAGLKLPPLPGEARSGLKSSQKEDERLWLRIYNRMFLEDVSIHYYFDLESPPWRGLPPVFPRLKSFTFVMPLGGVS